MINLALSDERVLSEQIVLGLFYSYKLFGSTQKQHRLQDSTSWTWPCLLWASDVNPVTSVLCPICGDYLLLTARFVLIKKIPFYLVAAPLRIVIHHPRSCFLLHYITNTTNTNPPPVYQRRKKNIFRPRPRNDFMNPPLIRESQSEIYQFIYFCI